MIAPILAQTTPTVIWVPVQKPTFDLVGVVLSSLGLAGICAAVALVLGIALGVVLIRRARRHSDPLEGRAVLRLALPDRAA
jgi:ABC-type spermidine/putrescine transport system permease subunit II